MLLLYAAGRLQIRDSKVQAARRKACYQRANLTEAAQSADYRSRGDRPEAMGDVHGDCATVQPRSRRRIVDPTFPLKIPSGYAAAFGLCGFSSAVPLPWSLPYLTRISVPSIAIAGGTRVNGFGRRATYVCNERAIGIDTRVHRELGPGTRVL